jgi:hypothetical protein
MKNPINLDSGGLHTALIGLSVGLLAAAAWTYLPSRRGRNRSETFRAKRSPTELRGETTMRKRVADVVEDSVKREKQAARNLPAAANADNSLEGYAAVNGLNEHDEIARIAEQLYNQRVQDGIEGTAEDDWFRAEEELRRTRRIAT